jgi:hypothetical protein
MSQENVATPVAMRERLELRRFHAWQVVLAYSVVTYLITVLVPRDIDPAALLINMGPFLLLIGFAIARGRRDGWMIILSLFAASAVNLFIGRRALDLPLGVRQALGVPVATALTYLLVDRRHAAPLPEQDAHADSS